MRIELCDGKYTYVINEDGRDQHALRYGERWRDLVGDGFVLAMAQEISEQQERIAELKTYLENVKILSIYVAFHDSIKDINLNQARDWLKQHDLEMEAKGIEWCLDCRETNLSQGEIDTFREKAKQLRKQANG